ncbi:uncharacterized protein F4812DRAFT_467945 [Daldinia caldariorum]|uniref:uncharacterized protein n=1 Tax=Daldinia caldariorum TaxID=326644 RepID=UPI0020085023|nr:uncharacterized protein F4812DRAFT_467945 [Daldinia caldariorum]KAI1464282.1 hypothetical protein F4812DRAFT_467945 [Daldinia caldariorum]
MSITRLESIILVLYFGCNCTMLILGRANIRYVAAMLAITNATPLFLGDRTNPLVDLIGIPLSTYYVFHHFIGRVVIIEAMIHAALVFRRSRLDQTTTSGYITRVLCHWGYHNRRNWRFGGLTDLYILRPLRSLRFIKGERLLIDGPYGQDLNLKYFKSVMLAAHGAGILGILSIARSIWEHRRSDDVLCRVNIFWSLERNSQGEWAAAYLKRLQELDAGNELFVVWCVYPSEKKETPVFEETSHWLYFHQVDRDVLLKHMMDATSERTCGDPDFSANVRKAVIDRRGTRPIEFAEVQYRPSTKQPRTADGADSEKGAGKSNTTDDADLEKGEKPRRMHSEEEDEEWDEITLYSPTGALVDDAPQEARQKKTD